MEEQAPEKKESVLIRIYDKKYKPLLVITFTLLILAIAQIGYQYTTTGDYLNKDVSLKGGLTVSINEPLSISDVESNILAEFGNADISVRELTSAGAQIGVIIESSDIDGDELASLLEEKLGLEKEQYSMEVMGGSLGESFFQETIKAIIIAFIFMGVVVFIYFSKELWPRVLSVVLAILIGIFAYYGNNIIFNFLALILGITLFYLFFRYSIPSVFVILSCFADIIETLAVVNLLGMKIGTAGIAAFLMLIGYSVDTDILLTTRVLKRKGESILKSIGGAAKTGLLLTGTAIVAVAVALFFAEAEALKEIMLIVFIGLVLDVLNTWIQNAGILRWYLERKQNEKKV